MERFDVSAHSRILLLTLDDLRRTGQNVRRTFGSASHLIFRSLLLLYLQLERVLIEVDVRRAIFQFPTLEVNII